MLGRRETVEPSVILRGMRLLSPWQRRALDQLDAGIGKLGFDFCNRAIQVDGAAGVLEDDGLKAESARIESRIADAVVVGKAGKEDARQAAIVQVASETSGRDAIIFKECGVGVDLGPETFAED